MKIDNVSSVNFYGLWEQSSTKVSYDNDGFKVYEHMKLYHPFADETEQQVNVIRRINTQKYTHNGFNKYDMYIDYSKCFVKERLPFTLAEWKTYIKDSKKLLPDTITKIETAFKKFNLSRV